MNVDLHTKSIEQLRNTYSHVEKYVKGNKPATRYEEATFGAQSTTNFHYRPTWAPDYELFDASRTKVILDDWYVLRDPRQFYYGNWTMTRAKQQDAMEASYRFVESKNLLDNIPTPVQKLVCDVILPLRHVAWGGNMNDCNIAAIGYGTVFTAPAMFHAMDQLGVAQYITRLGLTIGGTEVLDSGKDAWINQPHWQVLRRYIEDTFVIEDPFELFIAQNIALDGQLYEMIFESFVEQHLTSKGVSAIAMVTSFINDWFKESSRWIDAVIKIAADESDANNKLISTWVNKWGKRAQSSLEPIAELAFSEESQMAIDSSRSKMNERCKKSGLTIK